MSGHSKWATIKRAKEAKDAKRGNVFTKHANNITIAAREGGGDLDSNFKLRLAIDRAKAVNMPKDNIERAIKRGTGELAGGTIEEMTYGALLPGQVAVIIKCLSDNKNRTVTEVKTAITKNGGQFVDISSIAWQFNSKGVVKIKKSDIRNQKSDEELEMLIIDSGADDYDLSDDEEVVIYTAPEELKNVKDKLEAADLKINSADLEMVAKDAKEVDDAALEKVSKILDALDEVDDVGDYYTNLS